MEIVLIGTGNTATVLGKKLKAAGHHIIQVYGRDSFEASKLAYELGTGSTNYWNVVRKDADLYILAVSDIAISDIVREMHFPDKTIVHTAASVSKAILQKSSDHYGVFYPLQSMRKEKSSLPEMPVIIDASDPETLNLLQSLASSITDQVVQADDDDRLKLHTAAVFCNNFVNHIYTLVYDYCNQEKLDFNLLLPLIAETSERIQSIKPAEAQTGPAMRHDQATIDKHLQLLNAYPSLQKIYQVFTESIEQTYPS